MTAPPAPPDYIPGRTLRLARPPENPPPAGLNTPFGERSAPLSPSELRQTFGAVGTIFFAGIIDTGEYVPELSGEQALATYERMWRSDAQVAATVNVWVLPLIQATYSIEAASDAPEDVAIAQETSDNLLHGMDGQTWHNFLRQLYTNRAVYGHAVFEKCWVVDDQGAVRLRRLAPRLAKTLYRWYPNADDALDRLEQRVWINADNGVTGAFAFPTIPAEKLVVSTRNRFGNNFLGISVLRPAYKHWYYKDQLYSLDGIAAAKNAMGVPVYSEPENQGATRDKANRDLAMSALAQYQVNERAAFVNPAGWKFELLGVSGQVRNIMPSIEHHDLLIARSILAQFINVDSGGTLIAARDSSSFFLQALFGEAQEVADDVNPLIREMESYNYAQRTRFSTIGMQDLDQRDVEQYLRGLSALITAGGITVNQETEDAIRDNLNLPPLPEARGAGTGGVDPIGQGPEADSPEDAAEAAVSPAGDVGPEASATPQELRRRIASAWPSRHSIGGGRAESVVRVPRASGEVMTLRRMGGRWEPYARRPSTWAGVALLAEPGKGSEVKWILGDGGKSGSHCPQCLELAQSGWMAVDELDQEPGDGGTYCGDACTCRLEYRGRRRAGVGGPSFREPLYPAQGPAPRARGVLE